MKFPRLVTIALLGGLALLTVGLAEAGLKKSDSEVKIATDASKPDAAGKQTITITIDVNPGWYIYANPVNNKDFEGNRTEVKVFADKKELDAKVDYPEGKAKSLGDITYSVYTGKVTLRAHVARPEDAKELTLSIRLNTCNEKGLCLAPATVKLPVK